MKIEVIHWKKKSKVEGWKREEEEVKTERVKNK